jgi:hypothetical protein
MTRIYRHAGPRMIAAIALAAALMAAAGWLADM